MYFIRDLVILPGNYKYRFLLNSFLKKALFLPYLIPYLITASDYYVQECLVSIFFSSILQFSTLLFCSQTHLHNTKLTYKLYTKYNRVTVMHTNALIFYSYKNRHTSLVQKDRQTDS